MENTENSNKIDLQDMCQQITNLKTHCKQLAEENWKLKTEIADLRFTHKYLTSEEAGKQLAIELTGGA